MFGDELNSAGNVSQSIWELTLHVFCNCLGHFVENITFFFTKCHNFCIIYKKDYSTVSFYFFKFWLNFHAWYIVHWSVLIRPRLNIAIWCQIEDLEILCVLLSHCHKSWLVTLTLVFRKRAQLNWNHQVRYFITPEYWATDPLGATLFPFSCADSEEYQWVVFCSF